MEEAEEQMRRLEVEAAEEEQLRLQQEEELLWEVGLVMSRYE